MFDHPRTSRDAAAEPVFEEARLVNSMLAHYADYITSGPTLSTSLAQAMVSPSFYALAQALEDAAGPKAFITEFRRQWRRFHGFPDASIAQGRGSLMKVMSFSTFGEAVVFFVGKLDVDDKALEALVEFWRREYGNIVKEHSALANTFSLLLSD